MCRKQKFSECPENPRRQVLENIKNTGKRIKARGTTPCPRGWGRALPPGRAPLSRGQAVGPLTLILLPTILIKSTEISFRKYKKYWQKMKTRGRTPCPRGWGRALPPRHAVLSCGPPGAPPTSTPTLYIPFHGEKNQRESFIAFYDTEPPPSPNLSREG